VTHPTSTDIETW